MRKSCGQVFDAEVTSGPVSGIRRRMILCASPGQAKGGLDLLICRSLALILHVNSPESGDSATTSSSRVSAISSPPFPYVFGVYAIYTIQDMMVSKELVFHNELENVDYVVVDDCTLRKETLQEENGHKPASIMYRRCTITRLLRRPVHCIKIAVFFQKAKVLPAVAGGIFVLCSSFFRMHGRKKRP